LITIRTFVALRAGSLISSLERVRPTDAESILTLRPLQALAARDPSSEGWTTINAELAEPAEKAVFVLRFLR
jgi:hypothetical protein